MLLSPKVTICLKQWLGIEILMHKKINASFNTKGKEFQEKIFRIPKSVICSGFGRFPSEIEERYLAYGEEALISCVKIKNRHCF